MPRDTGQLMRRVGAALPAVALIGGGAALAATGGEQSPTRPVAQGQPQVSVPTTPLSRPDAPFLPALPPVPTEVTDAVPAAFATPPMQTDSSGIPARALQAYRHAAGIVGAADPGCEVDWALVAAIGRVESDHGRYAGNGIDDSGTVRPGIYGLPLNGRNSTAMIKDSDQGRLDHDSEWDRAVGPMQFIPTTWQTVGVDADGDGEKDPQNIVDAATATAVYLCSGPGDLSQIPDLRAAVLRYNQSAPYVEQVIAIAAAYRRGVTVMPSVALTTAQLARAPYLPTGDEQPASAEPASADATSPEAAADGQGASAAADGGSTGSTGETGSGSDGSGGGSEPEPTPDPSGTTPPSALDTVTETVKDTAKTIAKPPTSPTTPPSTPTPAPTTPAPQPTCLVLGAVRVGDICL